MKKGEEKAELERRDKLTKLLKLFFPKFLIP